MSKSSAARWRNALRTSRLCAKGTPPFPKEMMYLCNWFVKLVKPGKEIPEDQFQCTVPMKMTKFDIRNYFEKIYNIRVKKVNTRIQVGKVKRKEPGNHAMMVGKFGSLRVRRPDYKVAYVTMVDQKFKFPDLFSKIREKEQAEKEQTEREQAAKHQQSPV